MSMQAGSIRATAGVPATARRLNGGVIAWCAAAAVLLVGSGVFRVVQAARVVDDTGATAESPFPLRDIPKQIDTWRVLEGGDTQLDSQTTRITGSTDHILRTYCDEATGVTLSVLILYGPAEPVTPHTPQVCYPASGFAAVGDSVDTKVAYEQGKGADFRTAVFGKSGGRDLLLQTVYHSYRLNGEWSPIIDFRKLPRRNPGVFKVQIARRSFPQEPRGEDEPIEAFLAKLLPILERMNAEATTSPAAAKGEAVASRVH